MCMIGEYGEGIVNSFVPESEQSLDGLQTCFLPYWIWQSLYAALPYALADVG